MDSQRNRAFIGAILIVVGILFLLDSLGVVGLGAVAFGVVFAAAGFAFVYVFLARRDQWWAVIPGCALIGIGVLIAVSELAPGLEPWGGALFLGMLSLAFWIIYATRRDWWWAVIPGGVLATLAIVTMVSEVATGDLAAAVFFLGLAATFAVLSLLPTPEGRLTWALIPAAILAVIGVLIAAAAVEAMGYIWPIALMVLGVWMLWRTFSGGDKRQGGAT